MKQETVVTPIYDIPKAAKYLGYRKPWTLYKHVAIGNVNVTRLGRRVFLRAEEINRIQREGLPRLKPE